MFQLSTDELIKQITRFYTSIDKFRQQTTKFLNRITINFNGRLQVSYFN